MTPTIHRTRRRLVHREAPARFSVLEHDEFEGYASLFGVPDSSGDIVAPGAFAQSLRLRGPRRVRMLYQHSAHEPLGVWLAIREDSAGLHVKGRVSDIERGRDVLRLIRDGALDGLSIGFQTKRARRDAATGLRTLLEIELWEVSVVTFPLLHESRITTIGAEDDAASEIRKAAEAMRV
jgi:Escherichia/Staphylococcus phage prohead protease